MKHLNAANKLMTFGMENRKNCSQIIKDDESLAFYLLYECFLSLGLEMVGNGLAVGTSDFDAQMSGRKFWKGDENLRPVYKKTVFRSIERLLLFRTF